MQSQKVCLLFYAFFLVLTFIVKDNAFFWDTVLQASKHAYFFYENNFSRLILPLELDAGHPPFFGIYLGFIWKIFGKSLSISHFAMLPWLFGIVWQMCRFVRFYFSGNDVFWVLLLSLTNVTLLGQSALVSPDVSLVFFFLLAVNGILYQRKWQIWIGTIGMSLLNIRGILLIFSLFLYKIYLLFVEKNQFGKAQLKQVFFSFLPVGIIAFSYYFFHYLGTGWWLSTPNEGWSAHREAISVFGSIRKIVVLGWRLVDHGFMAFWIVFGLLSLPFLRSGKAINLKMKQLFGLPLIILLVFLPLFLFLNNPIAHRYLMPVYLTFSVGVCYLVFNALENKKRQSWAIGFIFLFQLSGNFWVYPKKIAQGWDGTLAHLPYYELRTKMIRYIDDNGIKTDIIGSEFPNTAKMKYLDLNNREERFHIKDVQKDQYILYSNIFNDFSDNEFEILESSFEILKEMQKGQICMILYKRKTE